MSGRKSPVTKGIAFLLVVFLSPIVFLGIPVRIAFNEWFIEWEYSKEDFPKDRYGMEDSYRKYLAKIGLRAVLSDEGMEEFKSARLPDGRKAFREKEIRHMEDVKRLLDIFFPLVYISVLIVAVALFVLRSRKAIGFALLSASVFSLVLFAVATAFSLTNYELAFELFHNFIFDPYSWRFRYSDTLLRIYPMKFWFDGTVFVLTLAGALCLLSLLTGMFLIRLSFRST